MLKFDKISRSFAIIYMSNISYSLPVLAKRPEGGYMKKYEVGFILRPNLSEDSIKQTIDQLKAIYTDRGANIIDEENVGLRELAYEIKHFHNGYYFFMVVEANHDANQEFERICRINENVIRFLVIDINDVEANTLDILRK